MSPANKEHGRQAESEQSVQKFSSDADLDKCSVVQFGLAMERACGTHSFCGTYIECSIALPPPPSPPPPPPRFQAEESMAWLPLVEACSMGSTPATTVMAVAASGVWPSVATTMTMLPFGRSFNVTDGERASSC